MLRLDDEKLQFQLHAGSLAVRVRSREVADELEVRTAEVRLRPIRAGHYRIDRHDDTTLAGTWRGELLVDDADGFPIGAGQRMEMWRMRGQGALQHRWSALPNDALNVWVASEDKREERSASSSYVSPEMTGAEDLDRYGRWDRHPEFGAIWLPISVQIGWAPYKFGHWARVGLWGWTWVDAAPWGFAPFHYGRWVSWQGQWCWAPGLYTPRPVFAPALVAWVGGPVVVGVGGGPRLPGQSWVPLAPHERYVPHYHASPGYQSHFEHQHRGPDRTVMPVPGTRPPMAVVAPERRAEPGYPGSPVYPGQRGERGDRGGDRPQPGYRGQPIVPADVAAPVARVRQPVPVTPSAPAPVAQAAVPVVVAPPAQQRPPTQGRGREREHERGRDADREVAREDSRARAPESRHMPRERENQR